MKISIVVVVVEDLASLVLAPGLSPLRTARRCWIFMKEWWVVRVGG